MGWSLGYDETWKRDIGYGVPAKCDHPGCGEDIHRGLAYVCGSEPYGGDHGCGLYFCEKHRTLKEFRGGDTACLCERCMRRRKPFTPTPDVEEWLHHKATDPSWAEWRKSGGV